MRPPKNTIWFGGLVDKTDVCLAVYGDNLNPDEVTRLLGCEPSDSHRRGEKMKRGISAWHKGAWLLSEQGKTPPEELTVKLLDRLPSDERIWKRLAKQHDLQLRFGLFLDRANRGLDLSPGLVTRISRMHAVVVFDIYVPSGVVDVGERPPDSAQSPPRRLRSQKPIRRRSARG